MKHKDNVAHKAKTDPEGQEKAPEEQVSAMCRRRTSRRCRPRWRSSRKTPRRPTTATCGPLRTSTTSAGSGRDDASLRFARERSYRSYFRTRQLRAFGDRRRAKHSYDALVGRIATLRQMGICREEGVEPIDAVGQEFNRNSEALIRVCGRISRQHRGRQPSAATSSTAGSKAVTRAVAVSNDRTEASGRHPGQP